MNELFNHLWQSTAFAGVVAAVCFGLRNNHARTRYWLWLAASLKFAVPFALLISFGRRVEIPVSSAPLVSATTVEAISTTFSPSSMFVPAAERSVWPQGLALVWALGAAALAGHWLRRWLRVRSILRVSEPLALDFPIPARTADSVIEPGVFGVWRPVLLLPDGLAKRLPPEQLQVILAHELCHVRFRDNLWSALHMLVNVVFWFHPVVWWIGAKMVQERERACDESVIRLGKQRRSVCPEHRERL